MSAEYSVEEALTMIDRIAIAYGSQELEDARAVLAERIKAGEGAVPVADASLAHDYTIVSNAMKDPSYAPYCMRCYGFVRMNKVEPMLWKHSCGAVHDERQVFAHPPAQAAQVDGRMSDELRNFIEGMSVSVDVSTGDADAGHRYFGTVAEVMDCADDKHGVTLLVQDAEPNFKAEKPVSSAAIEALRDVDHVVTQWRESGREPAYGQWLTLQDVVRAALATEPVAQVEVVNLGADAVRGVLSDYKRLAAFDADETAMRECLRVFLQKQPPAQPHSPDASDSGRVSASELQQLEYDIGQGKYTAPWVFTRMKQYIQAVQPRAVPDGWVLVPVEPTDAMCDAGDLPATATAYDIYKAMLAAAPSPGES